MAPVRGFSLSTTSVFLQSNSTKYICRNCRNTLSKAQSSNQQIRLASSKNLPFTEKLRRKIWGTDNPPGLKDPYGGPGFFERRAQRKKAEREAEQGIPSRITEQESELAEEIATEQPPQPAPALRRNLQQTPRDLPAQKLEKYVPAETWEGLEHIGSTGDWRSLPATEDETPPAWRNQFFQSQELHQASPDFATLVSNMHQAIVECLIIREARQQQQPNLRYRNDETLAVARTKVIVSSEGHLSHLEHASKEDQETFVDILSSTQNHTEGPENEKNTTIAQSDLVDKIASYKPEDQSFLQARLNFFNPLTFMILKRFSGLSGLTVPDPMLNSLRTSNKPLSHLLQQLAQSAKPKPKSLAETLAKATTLTGQSNVTVLPRRETPVDKEKELGRWKIIEKELTERGLPVLGRAQIE